MDLLLSQVGKRMFCVSSGGGGSGGFYSDYTVEVMYVLDDLTGQLKEGLAVVVRDEDVNVCGSDKLMDVLQSVCGKRWDQVHDEYGCNRLVFGEGIRFGGRDLYFWHVDVGEVEELVARGVAFLDLGGGEIYVVFRLVYHLAVEGEYEMDVAEELRNGLVTGIDCAKFIELGIGLALYCQWEVCEDTKEIGRFVKRCRARDRIFEVVEELSSKVDWLMGCEKARGERGEMDDRW